jgi:hypothetical protein
MMMADPNFSIAPSASPFWNKVAGNFGMETKNKPRSERLGREITRRNGSLDAKNSLRKQGSQLGIS